MPRNFSGMVGNSETHPPSKKGAISSPGKLLASKARFPPIFRCQKGIPFWSQVPRVRFPTRTSRHSGILNVIEDLSPASGGRCLWAVVNSFHRVPWPDYRMLVGHLSSDIRTMARSMANALSIYSCPHRGIDARIGFPHEIHRCS
jgi:hypothetical protein